MDNRPHRSGIGPCAAAAMAFVLAIAPAALPANAQERMRMHRSSLARGALERRKLDIAYGRRIGAGSNDAWSHDHRKSV